MTKKIILISTVLAFAMMLGLTSVASAAGEEVVFSAETPVDIYLNGTTDASDMVINAGGLDALSQVTSMVVDTDKVTLTLGLNSDITFHSASGKIISVDCSAGSTFTSGASSKMRVDYNASCTTVIVTIGAGTLTEVNVAASPLTEGTASAYTLNFKTVNSLVSTDVIKLDFGSGFTVAASSSTGMVTTLTDDGSAITVSSFSSDATTKIVTITIGSTVASNSAIVLVLSSSLITNPATATTAVGTSGIDIYTRTTGGDTIDSKTDQTAFGQVISLVSGWNVFAPSQELESSTLATVLTPISGSYSAIYTLTWDSSTSSMTWQTPSAIQPLYGYVVYNSTSSTIRLPLDFSKETISNAFEERNLTNKGYYLLGVMGTADIASQALLLDGLVTTDYTAMYDLTGDDHTGSAPTSHNINGKTLDREVAGGSTMVFAKDYGYAISTQSTGLVLFGRR